MRKVPRKIKRRCVVCGAEIRSKVNEKGVYDNGHYFGEAKIPVGKGDYKKVGVFKRSNKKYDVVKWTGKEKEMEYWECNKCFEEASREDWCEEKIRRLFGEKCPDYEPMCPVCQVWHFYETILEDNRGEL